MSKGKRILKIAAYVISAFILIFIGAGIGSSGAKTTVHDKAMDITALDKEISKDKKEYKQIHSEYQKAKAIIAQKENATKELNDTNAKLKDKQGELDKELAEGRKDIDAKLTDTKKQLADEQASLKNVQGQVSAKQKELSSLTGQIVKAKSAPKILSAGRYVVGKDIPAGRYIVTPVGEGSNFVTYDEAGTPDVNTILGSDGEPSYTFEIEDGYSIQTEATVKLTPVE